MLPGVLLQCQGSLRGHGVVGSRGRDVSSFPSAGSVQRTTSLESNYEVVVSAESPSQAALGHS